MKRFFHLSVTVFALSFLVVGIVWAGPAAPGCASQNCFVRDSDSYCILHEDIAVNKLVRGRAGQLEWVRTPTSRTIIEKCSIGGDVNLE